MSFPYLSDVVKALTGYDLPLPIAMFGLFVACAMLAAAASLKAELSRLHASGQLTNARRQVKGKDGVLGWAGLRWRRRKSCPTLPSCQRRSNPHQYGYNVGCLEGVNPFDLPNVPTNDGVNHPAD